MSRKLCVILFALAVLVTCFNVGANIKDEFFFSLDNLPEGVLIRDDYVSNSALFIAENYYFSVYEIKASGRFPSGVRVELRNDQTDERRTIYWQIGTSETVMGSDENNIHVIIINDVPIDITKDTYDCRNFKNYTYTVSN